MGTAKLDRVMGTGNDAMAFFAATSPMPRFSVRGCTPPPTTPVNVLVPAYMRACVQLCVSGHTCA